MSESKNRSYTSQMSSSIRMSCSANSRLDSRRMRRHYNWDRREVKLRHCTSDMWLLIHLPFGHPSPYGSPIFKVVQKKWYPALYRALTKSPISPESAVGEGAERSHVDRSGVAP